jgi:hypothetical protein
VIADRLARRARNGNFREVVRYIEQHKQDAGHEGKRRPAKEKHRKPKHKKHKPHRRANSNSSDVGDEPADAPDTNESEEN